MPIEPDIAGDSDCRGGAASAITAAEGCGGSVRTGRPNVTVHRPA